MKKIIYIAFALAAVLVSSCSNDDILIESESKTNDVNVTISLSNLYSTYNFNDTKHDLTVTEDYRTFYSEFEKSIEVRTLFYNSDGVLTDSLHTYATTTNAVSQSLKLAAGKYTVVTTLSFSEKTSSGKESPYWSLVNRENLSAAYIEANWRFNKWSILSYGAQTVTVTSGQATRINIDTAPVGALVYLYMQNFQYQSEATYGTVADNGIRSLCLYSQDIADGYRLDPNASEKYVYKAATGSNSWYRLSSLWEPESFSDDWTFFQTNLYGYTHILAPSSHMIFGYMSEGDSGFTGYGENTYSITNGQTYLAYWDYFQVGNPYFGIADNKHWHSYDSEAKARSMK